MQELKLRILHETEMNHVAGKFFFLLILMSYLDINKGQIAKVWNGPDLGCYRDSISNRQMPYSSDDHGSVYTCVQHCRDEGYRLAAVEDGYQCFCGDSFPSLGPLPDSSCNQRCRDNTFEICGGTNAMNVYTVCANKTYGLWKKGRCQSNCSHCLTGDICHQANGQCPKGCQPGWKPPLCQVEVCEPGLYGNNCGKKCGNCFDAYCNEKDGTCPKGCKNGFKVPLCAEDCSDGTYGSNCTNTCGHCTGGTTKCNETNGLCSDGCQPGWKGTYCKKACDSSHYGTNCNETCGHCEPGSSCNSKNGKCENGCQPGWNGTLCKTECSPGFYGKECAEVCGHCNGTCNHKNGTCNTGCQIGWKGRICKQACLAGNYGDGCREKCGHCQEGCDHVNGSCFKGCKAGWQGDKCKKACPDDFYGEGCNKTCGHCNGLCDKGTGVCANRCQKGWKGILCNEECPRGFYGKECAEECGHCNGTCIHTDGICETGCQTGWIGIICKEKACLAGNYGNECRDECGQCQEGCDHVNGVCFKGCMTGWQGEHCKKECLPGTWGPDCSKTCNCQHEVACDKVDGSCPGSNKIFSQRPTGNQSNVTPIAVSIPLIALIAAIVVVSLLIIRRRRKQAKESQHSNQEEPSYVNLALSTDDEKNVASNSPMTSNEQKSPENPNIKEKTTCSVKPNKKSKPGKSKQKAKTVAPSTGGFRNQLPNLSQIINVKYLGKYIRDLKKTTNGFQQEYMSLPCGHQHPCIVGSNETIIKAKNRYKNMLPYDHSRVLLTEIPGESFSDYINACYINGYYKENKFIATQGPKDTSHDFWRMVWEQEVEHIVMVTNLKEATKAKCDKYWSDLDSSVTFGNFCVTNVNEEDRPGFTVRTLQVRSTNAPMKNGRKRTVTQYHFTIWPDKDVPRHGTELYNFMKKVRESSCDTQGPIIVHCSAGVGRTGTFIALDFLTDQAEHKGVIDVLGCVDLMRQNRTTMVQTLPQYVFIYETMYEALTIGETAIPCHGYLNNYQDMMRTSSSKIKSRIEMQYSKLMEVAEDIIAERTFTAAKLPENKSKNRSEKNIPSDGSRVLLMTPVSGTNEYINAVYAGSYIKKDALVLTQLPTEGTVVDFWRMVYDYKSNAVVMLTNYKEAHFTAAPYWSSQSGAFIDAGPFKVETVEVTICGSVMNCYLSLTFKNKTKPIFLLGITDWDEKSWKPANSQSLFDLHSQVQIWQKSNKTKGPLVIQCLDGGMKAGMYAVVSWMFDMINTEQSVDIYQITKQILVSRPNFLTCLEQYQALYHIAADYLNHFQTYSNFR